MAIIKKIKLPNEATARDIGALSSNVIYDGDSGVTTPLNDKIQSIFTAIGNINSFEIAIVSELPATGDDHTIYFVPQEQGSTTHDEYMYVGDQWELIGTTTIDLSNYLQKSDISITQGLTTGVPAATITVDDTSTTIYSHKLIWSGTSSTSASVNAKIATCENFVLEPNCIVAIKFTNGINPVTTSYTLNVNFTGAYTIVYGDSSTNRLFLNSGETAYFQYLHSNSSVTRYWRFLFTATSDTPNQVIYYTCNSSAVNSTKSIGAVLQDWRSLTTSKLVVVKFTNENTADNPKLSDKNGIIPISAINENDLYWKAGDIVVFIISGSIAYLLNIIKPVPTISATSTLSTGTEIGSITIDGTTTTLYAPAAITPPAYSLSMTGATITLLADNVAASTITLPIWDGTLD